MAHYSTIAKIVIDVPPGEHDRELAFWQGAVELPQIWSGEYHRSMLPGHDLMLLCSVWTPAPAR